MNKYVVQYEYTENKRLISRNRLFYYGNSTFDILRKSRIQLLLEGKENLVIRSVYRCN